MAPDPAIFVIDLQDADNKELFFQQVFLPITLFEGTFTSFFKDKKSK
jgi:NhaP-type Na+/H+ or K+/H+ antiporter